MTQIIIKNLGRCAYATTWQAMREFTLNRTQTTPDELWLVEHPPVFTQGQAGKPEHILQPTTIPIIQTDRGGQVTYHGPGQLVAYFLVNLKKLNLGIKGFICQLETLLINLLDTYDIQAERKPGAPGIYVNNKKIASIGLRIRNGFTYHGIALNVDMDLTPFKLINPCGYADLSMCQIKDFYPGITLEITQRKLIACFEKHLLRNNMV